MVILGVVWGLSGATAADVSSQWNGGTGDWIEPLNWTHSPNDAGADYPHNDLLTYDVHFGGGEAIFPVASEFAIETMWMSGGALSGHTTLTLNRGFHTSGTQIQLDLTQIYMGGTSTWDAAMMNIGPSTYRIVNDGVQKLSDVAISLAMDEYSAMTNNGVFRKASGPGVASISGQGVFLSAGTIACDSGTLTFAVPCGIQGHVEAAPGAEVRFALNFLPSYFLRPTFRGGGTIVFENGPVHIDHTVTNSTTIRLQAASIGVSGPGPFENGTFVNESNGVVYLGSAEIAAYVINDGRYDQSRHVLFLRRTQRTWKSLYRRWWHACLGWGYERPWANSRATWRISRAGGPWRRSLRTHANQREWQ
jgi:hypothetical protein